MTLDELAKHYGIGTAYHDHRGQLKVFSAETRLALLEAMGVDAHGPTLAGANTGNPSAWPTVIVQRQGEPLVLSIDEARVSPHRRLSWILVTEEGRTESGVAVVATSDAMDQPPGADGKASVILALTSPPEPGYHQLTIQSGEEQPIGIKWVVTPAQCHEPAVLEDPRRLWGITVQLYTLKSASNWGIGDFGDLMELIGLAAPLGCGLIGLNPLHALFPANPDHSSPYSPSSRRFLNPLYISLPRIPETAHCGSLQQFLAGEGAGILASLRATATVDYEAVASLKLHWLRILHEEFRVHHVADQSLRAQAFKRFVAEGGEALRLHATFDALGMHLRETTGERGGWQGWPAPFRNPSSPEVATFASDHEVEVDFHLYLQWLSAEQLAHAQEFALASGMPVGLYGDIAVGVNAGGSETWSNPALYVTGVAIGAPPDPLALKGQDWGIPPQNPVELGRQGYEPFISLLRAGMRGVGAVRLDHVMALYRQWWVPQGFDATEGAYVHYPLDELMRLLCLESHRNRCIVIGEDLGTVPDAVRDAMQRHAVAHYKVMLFEKEPDGRFKPPAAYARRSIAAVTTHDLPTFKGWWESADIALSDRLGLYPDPATREQVVGGRSADRHRLMEALVGAGLWYWRSHEPLPSCSHALMRAVHLYVALSTAELSVVQLEDLAGMVDPVNVPGTYLEYPNWQRKMSEEAASILARPDVREMFGALSIARTGRNPN